MVNLQIWWMFALNSFKFSNFNSITPDENNHHDCQNTTQTISWDAKNTSLLLHTVQEFFELRCATLLSNWNHVSYTQHRIFFGKTLGWYFVEIYIYMCVIDSSFRSSMRERETKKKRQNFLNKTFFVILPHEFKQMKRQNNNVYLVKSFSLKCHECWKGWHFLSMQRWKI